MQRFKGLDLFTPDYEHSIGSVKNVLTTTKETADWFVICYINEIKLHFSYSLIDSLMVRIRLFRLGRYISILKPREERDRDRDQQVIETYFSRQVKLFYQ